MSALESVYPYYLASCLRKLPAAITPLQGYVFDIPMRTKFRGIMRRSGVLLTNGTRWVEVSPFMDYAPEYAARWLLGALAELAWGFPTVKRTLVPLNITVPALEPSEVSSYLGDKDWEEAQRGGVPVTAKVKVCEAGQEPEQDLARLAVVREKLGEKGKIRIDVNGKWDLTQAKYWLPRYNQAAKGLEYAEQPVADTADLARLRLCMQVPLAADESIRMAENPFLVKDLAAADIVVLKAQPLGGVWAALELAQDLELPTVVSSALETSVGLRAGAHLAAALPELSYACGLGTLNLLSKDVVSSVNHYQVEQHLLAMQVGDEDLDTRLSQVDAIAWAGLATDKVVVSQWKARLAQMWEYLHSLGLLEVKPDINWQS